MISVMFLVFLVMSLDPWAKGTSISGQRVLPSSSPLLNRFANGSRKDFLPSFSTTLTVELVEILQWDRLVIFFDHRHRDEVHSILPMIGLVSVHELQTAAGLRQKLLQLYRTFSPKLHFLLLLSITLTQGLLQIVDEFDTSTNRTTDFCHFSFWIAVNEGQPRLTDLPRLYHLENVAFIVYHETGDEELWQLLPTSEGRTFSTGKRLSECKSKEDVFPNTRHGLNNRTLIVSTLEDAPFVVRTGTGIGGYCFDIMDAIAAYLNFSYEVVNPADMEWGELIDGQWNGLIGQLAKREVDLVVAPITIHEDREKVMDFLYPPIFTKVDDIIYKLQPQKGEVWHIQHRPITPTLLLVLVITLLLSALTVCLLYSNEYDIIRRSNTDTSQTQLVHRMSDILLYLYGILLSRGLAFNPRNQSTRMLLFTWGMFSVLIAACYSAVKVSSFTVQKPQIPFRSLKEMVSQKEYKWGFTSGHIRESIIKSSKSDDMKMVWEGVVEFNKTDRQVLSKYPAIHTAKMKSEKYAYIMTRYRMQKIMSQDCNIRSVGEDILWEQYGIGVPSDYPLTKVLEKALAAIGDSGLLDIWWRQNWVIERSLDCDGDTKLDALKIQEMASVLFLVCFGLGAALVVLMLEKVKHKLKQQCWK